MINKGRQYALAVVAEEAGRTEGWVHGRILAMGIEPVRVDEVWYVSESRSA